MCKLNAVLAFTCTFSNLHISTLYQNRTLSVSETNSFVYNRLIVSCKSLIYKLACIGSIPVQVKSGTHKL